MKILGQFVIITLIWQLGELISRTSSLPIPGSILGMLILFCLLTLGIIKLKWIEECGQFFLKHLAFFFIPSGVALIGSIELLKANWLALLIIILSSTIIVMGITGLVVQKFVKEGE
ncbi:CidA/LrgA family protein [Clostridiaceae bacterium 35-E11]